jgi:ferredoxin-nitrate reductase
MLERALREQGIDVACDCMTTAIHEDRVELSTGETVDADLVIVAAGVTPETSLARRMGVQVDRGVLVDDSLRTNLPGVWAVGECAEHRGLLVGLVAPAKAMARAAAADIAGQPAAYLPGRAATRLKVAGIDLYCSGELDGDDEVVALDTRAGHYRHAQHDPRLRRRRSPRRPARHPRRHWLRRLREGCPGATGRGGRGRVPGRTARTRESD